MNEQDVRALLQELKNGGLSLDEAVTQLKHIPFRLTDLGYAQLDHHRALRQGLTEVIYGESKTPAQILEIAQKLAEAKRPVLATRLDGTKQALLHEHFPQGRSNDVAATFLIHPPKVQNADSGEPFVALLAAGTSDLRVIEEAAEVCVAHEVAHEKIYDVGVAGLHRLMKHVPLLQRAAVCVVAAGMEGALASVVGGLVSCPVVAVPTSVGYGASFGGLAALLAMLNSCAAGVTVVNIDAGFSAGFAAALMVRGLKRERSS